MTWRILCYHNVTERDARRFRAQLEGFRSSGFKFCSIDEGLLGLWPHSLTVTFDDANASVCTTARPILDELGVRATYYVATDYVAGTSRQGASRSAVTWPMLEAWLAAGHDIGSHTHTHISLRGRSREQVEEELALSKEAIRRELGHTSRHFAYPYGEHDAATRAFFARSDWASVATCDRGRNDPIDRLALCRDVVEPGWPRSRIAWHFGVGRIQRVYHVGRAVKNALAVLAGRRAVRTLE
jgi:peptidoglycan/xylan/chitin deacetylase (PgdA/CDA1 family)